MARERLRDRNIFLRINPVFRNPMSQIVFQDHCCVSEDKKKTRPTIKHLALDQEELDKQKEAHQE